MLYTISYDLITPGKNYQPLYDALARLGAVRIMLSEWAVRNGTSAVEIRDHLRSFIDSNDRLLVSQVADWASFGLMAELNKL